MNQSEFTVTLGSYDIYGTLLFALSVVAGIGIFVKYCPKTLPIKLGTTQSVYNNKFFGLKKSKSTSLLPYVVPFIGIAP